MKNWYLKHYKIQGKKKKIRRPGNLLTKKEFKVTIQRL